MRADISRSIYAGLTVMLVASISTEANADRAYGEYLAGECATCHNPSGVGSEGIPSIVNLPEDRFAQALKEYRTKVRPNPVMQNIAGRLGDKEIAALASYYASLAPATQGRKP